MRFTNKGGELVLPVIKSEHLEYANEVASDPAKFPDFLKEMEIHSPGLALAVQSWTLQVGREYGSLWHIGVVEFQRHVGWILGCLYAAYGKFPSVDRAWCARYLKNLGEKQPDENHKKMHEIHDELHHMHGVWMETFYTNRQLDQFSESATGRVLLLADMFLQAAGEEEDRRAQEQHAKETDERVANLSPSIKNFIEELDLSGFDKKNS